MIATSLRLRFKEFQDLIDVITYLLPASYGSAALSNPGAVWGIVGPAIGFFFVIFFVFGWAWSPYRRGYWGRRYRGYYGPDDDDAVQVLRQRYARGEITKEQLERMTRDFEQHSTRY